MTDQLKASTSGLSKSWKVIKQHQGAYGGGKVQVSKDGKRLVCLFEEDVTVLNVEDGQVVCRLQGDLPEIARESITSFCLYPDGDRIATASRNGHVRLWSIGEKKSLSMVKSGIDCPLLCLDVDATSTLVAGGSSDGSIRVWDMARGVVTHAFNHCHRGLVSTLKFHPDPQRLQLVSGGEGGSLKVFDLVTRDAVIDCSGSATVHLSAITGLAFSKDGWTLVTCGRDKVLNVFDLRHQRHLKTVPVYEELEGIAVILHEEAELAAQASTQKKKAVSEKQIDFVTAGAKGQLRSWRCTLTKEQKNEPKGKKNRGNVTAASPVTVSVRCTLTQAPESEGEDHKVSFTGLEYVKSASQVLATTTDHMLVFADQVSLTVERQIVGFNDDIISVKFIPSLGDAGRVEDGGVSHGDSTSQDAEQEDSANKEGKAMTGRVAVATNSGLIKLFDLSTFSCAVLPGHSDIVLALDVSADGRWLVSSSKDKTVRVWELYDSSVSVSDVASDLQSAQSTQSKQKTQNVQKTQCAGGRLVATLQGHTEAVGAVALSRKASQLATGGAFAVSGSQDRTIKIWDLRELRRAYTPGLSLTRDRAGTESELNGKDSSRGDYTPAFAFESLPAARLSVRAHEKDINAVAVSPNDRLVASASQDKTIRLWQSQDLAPVGVCRGHRRGVWSVAFSPVDRVLASSSGDRTVRLWSCVDCSCLRTFEGHSASVLAVDFVRAGMQLLSAGADGLLKLWTIRSNECENTFEAHQDKVWALAIQKTIDSEGKPVSSRVVTGGGDSRLCVWEDNTEEEEELAMKEREEKVLKEQELRNAVHKKQFSRAVALAFELERPLLLYDTLRSICEGPHDLDRWMEQAARAGSFAAAEKEPLSLMDAVSGANLSSEGGQGAGQGEGTGAKQSGTSYSVAATDSEDVLTPYLRELSSENISKLLRYCRDWNTNTKTSYIAGRVLNVVLRCYSPARLQALVSVEELEALVEALEAYSGRHFARLEKLTQQSFLLDYTLTSMKRLGAVDERVMLEGEEMDSEGPKMKGGDDAMARNTNNDAGEEEAEDSDSDSRYRAKLKRSLAGEGVAAKMQKTRKRTRSQGRTTGSEDESDAAEDTDNEKVEMETEQPQQRAESNEEQEWRAESTNTAGSCAKVATGPEKAENGSTAVNKKKAKRRKKSKGAARR